MINILDIIILRFSQIIRAKKFYPDEFLFVFILIFAPIAHGAVEIWSVMTIQIVTAFIVMIRFLYLFKHKELIIYYSWIDILALAFLSLVIFSIFLSKYTYASWLFFYKFISYIFIFYYVFYIALNDKSKYKALIYILVIFSTIYATVALTVIGSNLLGLRIFSVNNTISLFFANRNHFAGYLEMVLFLGISLFIINRGAKRFLLQVLTVYIGIAIFFSLSRGGIIALMGGIIFLSLLLALQHTLRRYIWFIISFAVLLIGIMSILGIEPVLERLSTLEEPELAGKGRLEYWQGTINLIQNNLWFGTGTGTFIYTFPGYQTEYSANIVVNHAHNDYLELLAEMGIIGFTVFIAVVILFFYSTIPKLIRIKDQTAQIIGFCSLSACVSFIIHSFFEFNFHISSNIILFIVCTAITLSISYSETDMRYFSLPLYPVKKRKSLILAMLIFIFITYTFFSSTQYIGDTFNKSAKKYQKDRNYELAYSFFRKAMLIDHGNSEHSAACGDLFMAKALTVKNSIEMNTYLNRSLGFYNDAIQLCPIQSHYYTKKFICLKRLQRKDDALSILDEAIRISPMRPYNYYCKADFYLENGNIKKACSEYGRYYELSNKHFELTLDKIFCICDEYNILKLIVPDRIDLKKRFAKFLFTKGKNKEAIHELEQIYFLEPNAENAFQHLKGLCRTDQCTDAQIIGEKYIALYNDDISILKIMASIYNKLNCNDKTKEIYEQLLSKYLFDPDIYIGYASYYGKMDKYNEGIDILKKGIFYNPNNAKLYYALSSYYRKCNQPDNCIDNLKRAVFIRPENIKYRFNLAIEYKKQGLYQQAVEHWQKCLEIDPKHESTLLAISRIYKELGIDNSRQFTMRGSNKGTIKMNN